MRVILVLAVILVAGLVIGLSCDKATEPVPNGNQKQYSVFFRDWGDTLYIQYTPETGKIDSIYLPFQAWAITSSHDGKLLYLAHYDSTMVYELATGELSLFEPGGGRHIIVSPDGKYMALEGENFKIIRLSDLAVVHQDTAEVCGGRFAPNSPTYYGGSETYGRLYRVSLEPVPNVELIEVGGAPGTTVPAADERLVFLRWAGLIEVYDIQSDSFLFSRHYGFSDCLNGFLAATPGSRRLLFSNPNQDLVNDGCYPYQPLRVYDVTVNDIIQEISIETYYFDSEGDSVPHPVDAREMIVTPDGRWLVVLDRGGPGTFVAIDLNDLTIKRHEYIGPWNHFRQLTGPLIP